MSMTSSPDITFVIVSYNTRDLLRKCLESIRQESIELHTETIVVDNASRDGSADMVRQAFTNVVLIESPVNLGFAAANNRAFEKAQGQYVVWLNSDAFFTPGALKHALAHMAHFPKAGLAGGQLIGRDNAPQPSARAFPSPLNEFLTLSGLASRYSHSRFFGRPDRTWSDLTQPAKVDWLPGAFLIIRRQVLEMVGYFDENMFIYFEEVDLCRRIREAGFEVWYWPDVRVIHLGGESSKTVKRLSMSSSGSQLSLWRMRSQFLYYRKHHGFLGAFGSKMVEKMLHQVRALKNSLTAHPDSQTKKEESKTIISLLEQAWNETRGGSVSPSRPW